MSDRLTEAMHEQENGSKEILAAIRNINTVTTEVKAGSDGKPKNRTVFLLKPSAAVMDALAATGFNDTFRRNLYS